MVAPPAVPLPALYNLLPCRSTKRIKAHLLSSSHLSSLGIHPSILQSLLVEVLGGEREPSLAMSRGNGGGGGSGVRSTRLELQLNLSPPVAMEVDGGGGVHHDDSDSSSPSSCVSSDGRSSSSGGSPGGKSPMVIGACTRCLMYCMVAKKDYPTCINCKQPCLVDLLHGEAGGGASEAAAAADNKKQQQQRGKRK